MRNPWVGVRHGRNFPSFTWKRGDRKALGEGSLSPPDIDVIVDCRWLIMLRNLRESHMKTCRSNCRLQLILVSALGASLIITVQGRPESVSSLYAQGYAAIPQPQQVKLEGDDFRLTAVWRLELGRGVEANSAAVEALKEGFEGRYGFKWADGGSGPAIRLAVQPGSVLVGDAQDKDKEALAEQAYKLQMKKMGITITANAPAGLFYGVETLVQLAKPTGEGLRLPEGEIIDWPDVQYREIFWDEQFHLDHLDVIKQAIRRAAFSKSTRSRCA